MELSPEDIKRLEVALYVMQQETGCSDERAEALLARWNELNKEIFGVDNNPGD